MMKLHEMDRAQLRDVERQLNRTARNGLDQYQRWEAAQKLKLVQAEIKKRRGISGLFYRVRRMFFD